MKENYMVCNCKQVRYSDIADALHQMDNMTDVMAVFERVKEVTHCSTGCGGCHDKVVAIISDILMGHAAP